MLEDVGEEGILTFLLFSVQFSDAVHTDFEGLGYDDFLNKLQKLSLGELSFNNVDINVPDMTVENILEGSLNEWLSEAEENDPVRCGFPKCKIHDAYIGIHGCQVCLD